MLTNEQLIESLIVDCNGIVGQLAGGQYVAFCATVIGMVQKLTNLKKGIVSDLQNRDEVIAQLKEELRKAGQTVIDCKPEELEETLNSLQDPK